MATQAQLVLDTVVQLKSARVSDGTIVLVTGAATMNDGRGGFYRWDPAASGADDTATYNVIVSSRSASGRWVRIFQRVRVLTSGAKLLTNGGAKTLIIDGTTDANGEVTVSLVDNDSSAIFASVWMTQGEARPAATESANDVMFGSRKSLTPDLKTLVFRFSRGSSTTLGGSLLAILGLIIPGLRAVPAGTPVTIRVDGM
jgi:hypothetical protein